MSGETKICRLKVPAALLGGSFSGDLLEVVDVGISDGVITSVERSAGLVPTVEPGLLDGSGWIGLPCWIDAHTHLDKTHSWDRSPNHSGTFAEALEVLGADRGFWSEDDLFRRAQFALKCAYGYGTAAMRSHVDTGHDRCRMSWSVLADLRAQWVGRIELQLVSLCGVADYSGPQGEALADLPVEYGAAALGGMPVMNPDLPAQLDRLLELAAERGLGLDLHVDESGDPGARCLEAVAEAVLRREFPHPVTCGHCCSLAVQDEASQRRTLDLVQASGIHVISLPLCNLYLQDRALAGSFPQTPRWRGVTLLADLLEAGVVTACASDNVRDGFYAFGDYDLFEVFRYSMRLGHLDSRFGEAISTVTRHPAQIMGLPDFGRIAMGNRADLVLYRARSVSELLSRAVPERRLIRGGREVLITIPDFSELAR